MKPNLPPFVQQIAERDPKLYEAVKNVMELANAPGALDAKIKILINLALDAYIGSEGGVIALSNRARSLGATDQEINEVLRIAYSVSGSRTLITGNNAFPKKD